MTFNHKMVFPLHLEHKRQLRINGKFRRSTPIASRNSNRKDLISIDSYNLFGIASSTVASKGCLKYLIPFREICKPDSYTCRQPTRNIKTFWVHQQN